MKHPVVRVEWIESERGWGQRHDGYSYHLTNEDADTYIKEYWATQPDGPAPDVYYRPGERVVIDVNDDLFKKIKKSKNGVLTS